MNRRSFFKRTLGFIGGIFATSSPSKAKTSTKEDWNNLGCEACFKDCGQFDDCNATLNLFLKEQTKSQVLTVEKLRAVKKELDEEEGGVYVPSGFAELFSANFRELSQQKQSRIKDLSVRVWKV